MTPVRAEDNTRYARLLFALGLLLLAAFAVAVLGRPLPWLLNVVPDDAFYYLRIGQNLAGSGRSTFDGVSPTNGYHPAWMLVVTLLARAFPDRVMLLQGALGTSFLFHAATGLVLVKALRKVVGEFRSWIGGALWLLNPFALLMDLQFVETSLYLCSLSLLLAVYLGRIEPSLQADTYTAIPLRGLILLGCTLGVAFLCRTDAIVIMPVLLACILYRIRRSAPPGGFTGAAFRTLAAVGGTALVVLLPWLVYSHAIVGTIVQDSGAMKAIWASETRAGLGPLGGIVALVDFFRFNWFGFPLAALFDPMARGRTWLTVAAFLLLGGMIYAASRKDCSAPSVRMAGVTVWLGLTALITGVVYRIAIGDVQAWHMGASGFILFVLLFAWGALALDRLQSERWSYGLPVVLLFALALLLFVHFWRNVPELYPWQYRMYTAIERFAARMPTGSVIGCFDAGIPAYFGARTTINIDGLVNHTAVAYWRNGQFQRLIPDQHIEYIIDTRRPLDRALRFSSGPVYITPVDSIIPLDEWPMFKYYLWRVDSVGGR